MSTLTIGGLRVELSAVPLCSGCSRWGRDWRCDCRGTGRITECCSCGKDIRGDAGCYRFERGPSSKHEANRSATGAWAEGHYYTCASEECAGKALTTELGNQLSLTEMEEVA